MQLEHIDIIRVIIEETSINKASKRLFMNQSSLTRIINSLEEELGFKLFERTKLGIVLTKQGKVFYDEARVALDVVNNAKLKAQNIKEDEITINIGICESIREVVIKLCQSINQKYPNYKFNFVNCSVSAARAMLNNRTIDIMPVCDCDEDFYFKPVFKSKNSIMAKIDNPISANDEINLADLSNAKILLHSNFKEIKNLEMIENRLNENNVSYESFTSVEDADFKSSFYDLPFISLGFFKPKDDFKNIVINDLPEIPMGVMSLKDYSHKEIVDIIQTESLALINNLK